MAWARIADDVPRSVVNSVKQGSSTAVTPRLGFEVTTRNNDRELSTCTLYMRWNPEKEDPLVASVLRKDN